MTSSKISFCTRVTVIGVNMGSKGHVNRVKGTVKIRIQNLRFYNSDIFTIAQCAINLQLYGYLHNAYNKLFYKNYPKL